MRYEQPPNFNESELETELASTDPQRIAQALLSSFYSQEPSWVEARCLEFVASESPVIRHMVAIVLGNISNIAAEHVRLEQIVDALSTLANDPEASVRAQADDSLSIALQMLQRHKGVQ